MTISPWWSFWWRLELMWMCVTTRAGLHSTPQPPVDSRKSPGDYTTTASSFLWNLSGKKPALHNSLSPEATIWCMCQNSSIPINELYMNLANFFITIILKLDIDIYHTLYTKYSINRGFCEISKKRDVTVFRKGLWQTAFAIFKPLVEFGEVVQ